MERRIKGVLSPKASGSITITENGNYDVVDVANAIVNVVPEEVGGITPEGSITLTSNGVYDVTMYAEAVVDVENVIPEGYVKPSGTLNVTTNGTFDVTEKKNVSVNVPQPSGTIEITENGVVDVTNYANANVNIATSGYTIEQALVEFAKSRGHRSNRNDISYLFYYYQGDINSILSSNTFSKSYIMNYLFMKASPTTKIPNLVFNNSQYSIKMEGMFSDYEGSMETLPSKITFETQTSIGLKHFMYCSNSNNNVTYFPILLEALQENAIFELEGAFYSCKLTELPSLDWKKVRTLTDAFKFTKITNIPDLDLSKLEYGNNAFGNISTLISVGNLKTSKCSNMSYFFYYDTNLETVGGIDMIKATSVSSMFDNCSKLTNLTLYNIKVALKIGSGTSWGHLLTQESLIQIIGELIDTGSNKTLTIGSANLSKLADVYVKITSTDADENGNVKLPFEVCSASDEGAMLITNYVTQKHWSLA